LKNFGQFVVYVDTLKMCWPIKFSSNKKFR